MAKDIKENNKKETRLKEKIISKNKPEEASEGPKIKIGIITDFLIGFVLMWVVLYAHASATLTQFWGLISNAQVALSVSLVLSVILLIVYAIFLLFCIFGLKRPFIAVGSVVALPLVYLLSKSVQQGFAIFFYFI